MDLNYSVMVKILLYNKVFIINNVNLTILEDLEKQGISANFQCRNGICGACRCKLISGRIKYIKEPLAYIKKNQILICISKAQNLMS